MNSATRRVILLLRSLGKQCVVVNPFWKFRRKRFVDQIEVLKRRRLLQMKND